jgi:hypothetical protein
MRSTVPSFVFAMAVVVVAAVPAAAHAAAADNTDNADGADDALAARSQAAVAAFRARMDALAVVLTNLLTDALDPRLNDGAPEDVPHLARIADSIKTLRSVSHALSATQQAGLPDADPTLELVLSELSEAVVDVHRADRARLPQVALSLSATCIACHSRMPATSVSIGLAPLRADLDGDVKADIYAATRRFDDARAAYRGVVFDEDFAAKNPWRYERALRVGLALEVRVAQSPTGAQALVDQALLTPGAEPLWPAASAWARALKGWRNEPPQKLTSDVERFDAAAAIMNRALAEPASAGDASDEVLFLRASALLHQALSTRAAEAGGGGPKSARSTLSAAQRAQALSWLGVAYERLTDLDVWGSSMFYDAACVETLPHSALARSCVARFERAALERFSGNSGAPLPPALSARLAALKEKARPRSK